MSRLIDADDLIDSYKHMGYDPTEHEEESYMEGWCKGFNAAVEHCISHVIHAQTIEPQRIKGKWVWNENGMDWGLGAWCCSECGHKPETWWESDKRNNPLRCAGSRFCGNCGAYMRGGQNGKNS